MEKVIFRTFSRLGTGVPVAVGKLDDWRPSDDQSRRELMQRQVGLAAARVFRAAAFGNVRQRLFGRSIRLEPGSEGCGLEFTRGRRLNTLNWRWVFPILNGQ